MSYTPVVRWRNFKIENVKTILELFPDMLVRTNRNTVVNELEKSFQDTKQQRINLLVRQVLKHAKSILHLKIIFSPWTILDLNSI